MYDGLNRMTAARESGPTVVAQMGYDAAGRRSSLQLGPSGVGSMVSFDYDMSDPDGARLPNKLLHNYLRHRLGQCVSMPILFLILGERLELNVALARAPAHFFIRYTAPDGKAWNLETTSGAHPARLDWFRQNMPMSERALESGLYMRAS